MTEDPTLPCRSYAGGAASKPKGALLDNGAKSIVEALLNYRDAKGVAVLKERFDAQVEWVRPSPATHAILIQLKAALTRD